MDKRGRVSRFSSKVFCLTVPEISVEESFNCCNNFGYRKSLDKAGSITIFRRSFCLTVPKYFIGEHFGVSEKFFYRMHRRGGITVLSELFVSQDRNEKLCKGTLLFSGNFLVSKKSLWIRGGISRFSVEIFMSHNAEKIRGHPFNVSENLGYRKFLGILGGITFFRRKFLVSQCRKNSWASLQCFRKFGVPKIFRHTRGYNVFPSKIFGLTVPKNFVGISSMFQKIWGIEKF